MGDAGEPSPTHKAVDRKLPTRPRDEIARLGDEIYERDIRPQVEVDHGGEIVSIDVDTGKWAVGDDILEAVDRLRAHCPGGYQRLVPADRPPGGAQFRRQVPGDPPVILGTVNDSYEAVIILTVRGLSGLTTEIEAVIDTGFTGFVSLPPTLVTDWDCRS